MPWDLKKKGIKVICVDLLMIKSTCNSLCANQINTCNKLHLICKKKKNQIFYIKYNNNELFICDIIP